MWLTVRMVWIVLDVVVSCCPASSGSVPSAVFAQPMSFAWTIYRFFAGVGLMIGQQDVSVSPCLSPAASGLTTSV